MGRPARRLAAVAGCVAGALWGAQGAPAQVSPPQQQKPPVFRAGANLVLVDAYPTRDGKLVDGLTAKDFQIFEDGKPQSVESFEFIRIELNTPEAERRDPNSTAEANREAADPRNRVFVLYLDHYFGSLTGSYNAKRPIVDMLNRMLSPTDLFGVATVRTRPMDLLLGRKTMSIEDQLERHWTWGLQSGGSMDLEPEEQYLERCYGEGTANAVARRTREERTLRALSQLSEHLGAIREARKVVVIFTRGWPLAKPEPGIADRMLGRDMAAKPRVGVTPTGQLSMTPANVNGMADWARCNSEIQRAFDLDNERAFRDLIDTANRNNVVFYPVNPAGLEMTKNWSLWPLAENTGGFTSETNDVSGLLRRIADDVSAYYVLGYYSTNSSQDGSYRRIEVKLAQPGVKVRARPGYRAAVARPESAAAPARPVLPEGLDEALGVLARLRPSSEVFAFGAASSTELFVVVELASQLLGQGAWAKGADVTVEIADTGGATTTAQGRIEPGLRGALVRIPRPAADGPYRVTARATAGGEDVSERLEVAARVGDLVGAPLLFRAGPGGQSPLRAVADLQYRRTERAHIEWPIHTALDRRSARLLARDGRPLAVPITVTERDAGNGAVVAADLNLAPLAPGDYVIELSVGAGEKSERRFVAIRVRL